MPISKHDPALSFGAKTVLRTGAATLACLVLAACGDTGEEQTVFPSPDGNIQLIHEVQMGAGVAYAVYFKGSGKRVMIGSAGYPAPYRVFWIDNDTVNICDFESNPPRDSFQVVGYDDKPHVYHVTSRCPDGERRSEAQPGRGVDEK